MTFLEKVRANWNSVFANSDTVEQIGEDANEQDVLDIMAKTELPTASENPMGTEELDKLIQSKVQTGIVTALASKGTQDIIAKAVTNGLAPTVESLGELTTTVENNNTAAMSAINDLKAGNTASGAPSSTTAPPAGKKNEPDAEKPGEITNGKLNDFFPGEVVQLK